MGIFRSPRERFARRVLATLRGAGVTDARYDPDEFVVEFGGGRLYLGNVFQECRGASRAERNERIAGFVGTVLNAPAVPTSWADARAMLRPVLRAATFALAAAGPDKQPVHRPALPYLHEFVVVDTPTAMSYVTTSILADWGVTEVQVFDAARANLTAMASLPPPRDGPAVVRFVDDGDGYFVSRLLVEGWLAGLEPHVGGRPVAFAPDTNTLVVVADHPEGLPGMLQLIEKEYHEAARPVSPCPYTVDRRGVVVPYTVADGHPLYASLTRAAAILAGDEYAAQASWLDHEYERDRVDVFVARLMVMGRPDGTVFTTATWSRDVDTLLPRADFVGVYEDQGKLFHVPWAVLDREIDLDPVPGLDPVRYRLRTWPPHGVMDRLRTAAVDP